MLRLLFAVVLSTAFLSFAQGSPPPPFWGAGKQYNVWVNMTNPDPIAHWRFHYYFDAISSSSRYEHLPPQYDEMCGGLNFSSSELQCNTIFANDGWSYIQFPAVSDGCCKCENTFGAVKYDWLQANATFAGIESVRGIQCQKWVKMGHEGPNNVFCTDDKIQRTVRFNELWGPMRRLKQWDFDMDSYVVGAFDRALVSPPPGCTALCENWCKNYRD